ncbi:uncharacterized protein LOC102456554 [Pelodiscus sinensis]|uniref:uncharacterized protein LOC102456554 n=1 Tax=Pelodiscus sinensis TaxID=13735 RepID=UPI003F6CCEF3
MLSPKQFHIAAAIAFLLVVCYAEHHTESNTGKPGVTEFPANGAKPTAKAGPGPQAPPKPMTTPGKNKILATVKPVAGQGPAKPMTTPGKNKILATVKQMAGEGPPKPITKPAGKNEMNEPMWPMAGQGPPEILNFLKNLFGKDGPMGPMGPMGIPGLPLPCVQLLEAFKQSINKTDKVAKALAFLGVLTTSGGKIYSTNGEEADFITTVEVCKQAGGHIATPKSKGENDAILKILEEHEQECSYLGFQVDPIPGKITCLTGNPLNYTNWLPDEPSYNEEEKCVQMCTGGTWNTTICNQHKFVICQF